MSLSKSDLLGIAPLTKWVSLRGGDVLVKELSAAQATAFEKNRQTDPASAVATAIMHGTVYADGSPVFAADDIESIKNMAASSTTAIATAIFELSGMTTKTGDEKKENATA